MPGVHLYLQYVRACCPDSVHAHQTAGDLSTEAVTMAGADGGSQQQAVVHEQCNTSKVRRPVKKKDSKATRKVKPKWLCWSNCMLHPNLVPVHLANWSVACRSIQHRL